jgi:hypothetical protein
MARSTRIYILMRDTDVLAAFTVKREMHEYAHRNDLYGEDVTGGVITVVSLPDGGGVFGGKTAINTLRRDL